MEHQPLVKQPAEKQPAQEDPVLVAAKKRALEPPLGPQESLDHLRKYFATLNLMQLNFKKSQIAAIKRVLQKYEPDFFQSQNLENDTPKHVAYMQCMLVYETADYLLANVNDWAANQPVNAALIYFPSKNYVKPQGKGVTCIFGSYKFPLSSVLVPMLYAIASGNCCLIKGSDECPETVRFLKKLAHEAFDPRFYRLIEGNNEVNSVLFGLEFDSFYYTGDAVNGRELLGKAGKNLVPCTVDMESKCPTVVSKDADLKNAARVIASTAFMNGGLMPNNTDSILVDESVYEEFKKLLVENSKKLWGGKLSENRNWSKVLNDARWERLDKLTKSVEKNIVWQGGAPQKRVAPLGTRFFPPTILEKVNSDAKIMQTPVNGPVVCLMSVKDSKSCVELLNSAQLKGAAAIYFFGKTNNSRLLQELKGLTRSGSLVVNDTWMPLLNANAPAENSGTSGWGAHGGRRCFDEFSLQRAVAEKSNSRFMDAEVRYPDPNVTDEAKLATSKKLGKLGAFEPWSLWVKIRFFVYFFVAFLLWKLGFWTLTFPLFERS